MNPPRTLHAVSGSANEARCDLRQRDIVDDAILLMRAAGTLSALEFLKSHAVDTRIITRVLLDPSKRRAGANLSPACPRPAAAGSGSKPGQADRAYAQKFPRVNFACGLDAQARHACKPLIFEAIDAAFPIGKLLKAASMAASGVSSPRFST